MMSQRAESTSADVQHHTTVEERSVEDVSVDSMVVIKVPDQDETDWEKMSTQLITRASIGFLFVYSAFNASQGLQSSINQELGTLNHGVLYTSWTCSCLFAAPFVRWLEAKFPAQRWQMLLGASPYVLLVATQLLVPSATPDWTWALYIIANTLVGMGASLLWTAQTLYLGRCALNAGYYMAQQEMVGGGEPTLLQVQLQSEKAAARLNGLFFSVHQSAGVVGTIVASVVFAQAGPGGRTLLFSILTTSGCIALVILGTMPHVQEPPAPQAPQRTVMFVAAPTPRTPKCIDDVPAESEPNWEATMAQDNESVDSAPPVEQTEPPRAPATPRSCAALTLCVRDWRFAMLVPITVANGMSLMFLYSDYPLYFVDPVGGVSMVGAVLATYYASNAVCNRGWALIVPRVLSRRSAVLIASIMQIMFFVMLLLARSIGLPQNFALNPESREWEQLEVQLPSGEVVLAQPEMVHVFLLLMGPLVMGAGAAVYLSMIPATVQLYFPRGLELVVAASAFKMWQAFGYAVQSLILDMLLIDYLEVRIVLVIAIICAGAGCFVLLDIKDPIGGRRLSMDDGKGGKIAGEVRVVAEAVASVGDAMAPSSPVTRLPRVHWDGEE